MRRARGGPWPLHPVGGQWHRASGERRVAEAVKIGRMHLSSNFARGLAALGLAFACVRAHAVAADAQAPTPEFGIDDIIADRTQVEWSQAYLQWIAAFAHDSSPISDTSGALCAAKQEGDVWFLATSNGTAPVVRTCAVPAGKALFVPLASTIERSGNREPMCASMASIAAQTITLRVTHLSLAVDGLAVDNVADHRLATGTCFALGVRQVPRLAAATTVGDGYYVMLRPLAPGAHTIVVGAQFDGATLSTTYHLDVH